VKQPWLYAEPEDAQHALCAVPDCLALGIPNFNAPVLQAK
jgi:hypothetical protein